MSRKASLWYSLALAVCCGMPHYAIAAQWRATPPKDEAANASAPKAGSTSTETETLLELLDLLESLQTEVRQLRNQTEVQQNEIRQLRSRLQDLTQDLDRRVRILERHGVPGGNREPTATSGTTTTPPTPAPPAGDEQQVYDAAFQLMKQGDYAGASRAFRAFINRYPSSSLASNAQYWIAESNYFVRNFRLALKEFLKVENQYPDSRKLPDAMLKIGYTYYELGEWEKARQYLEEVIKRYPNTRDARSAQARLATMKKEGH
jgi:tol-pal system protein YbgF